MCGSSKQKTTSNQTTNQTATTTPNTPSWLQQPWQDYTGKVTDLMNSGQSLVAGPSELQNQAFQGAANLAPSQNFDWATQLGLKAGTAGANTATANGYSGQGYAPATGTAAQVDPSQFGVGQTSVGPVGQASSRSITDLNLNDYLNAGLGDQITATQADYDATGGRVRAGQSGQAALNGGSRNSNNAVMQAITEGELSRAANTGIANVRANAYDQAGNLATNDLNREAQTSVANAGFSTQGALAQAQIDASRASQIGSQGFQAGLANQGAQNQFGLANMDSLNQAGQFGANAQNQANQFNAGALNQNSQFNAGQQDGALERMLQSAGLLSNIGQSQGADQRAIIGMQADLGGTQRDIANAQQQDQYAQLAMIQQLLGGVPIDAFTGQTMNSNGTQSGKSSTTQFGASMGWNPATGFSFGG